MAASSVVTVAALRPNTKGADLVVKVVDIKAVTERVKKGTQSSVECIVGDETGSIVLMARKEQVDLATKGATLELSGAKIEMVRGSMRLAVDASGKFEKSDKAVTPKTDYNVSLIEFEMVSLAAAGEV